MKTLFEAFEDACRQYAGGTALVDSHTGIETSYNDLEAQVKALQNNLVAHCPLRSGDRVGILMANQAEFIQAFFALQGLGAIVIPLNYRLSSDELREILKNADVKGIITSQEFEKNIEPLRPLLSWLIQAEKLDPPKADSPCPILSMADWVGSQPSGKSNQLSRLSPQDIAVLIYTSGTTGKPKWVMLSHHNLLADAKANAIAIEACQDDVFITTSPLFHVFGLTNVMLTALLNGARIVLVKRFNPKTVLEAISEHRVTFLAAVPTMYQMMLTVLAENASYNLQSLRVCHSGAAPMHQAVFHQVEEAFGAPVQEGYGQSEASSIVTSNPLKGLRKPGSIGLPLYGLTLEIVDETDTPLPAGEIGQLRVWGETVMQGYWNNPEASAKALRQGWLYTSDMGYKDEDGYIFLSGRRDDMINVGGAKVYPQEVEEALYQHPGVQSCAVTAEASELYFQVVAAYIVSHVGESITPLEIQKFCRKLLAEYKVPKAVYLVEEIPKGPTGKILRGYLKSVHDER